MGYFVVSDNGGNEGIQLEEGGEEEDGSRNVEAEGESVWYNNEVISMAGDCPLPVGVGSALSSSTNAAPILSIDLGKAEIYKEIWIEDTNYLVCSYFSLPNWHSDSSSTVLKNTRESYSFNHSISWCYYFLFMILLQPTVIHPLSFLQLPPVVLSETS